MAAAAAAAAAVAVKQPFCSGQSSSAKESRISCGSVYTGRRRPDYGILSSRFCDQGHLQYYNSKIGCSSEKQDKSTTTEKPLKKMKMKKKKQLKLLKGLTRDLSTFSQIGFGLDSPDALIDQVKGNMISEAAEVLLEQLQKRRAEEKELKRKMKEEKARLKAAARMQNCVNGEMSSASSSSESSDSECGEVIDMKQVKRANAALTSPQPVTLEEPTHPLMPTVTSSVRSSEEKMVDLQLSSLSNVDTKNDNTDDLSGLTCTKKIEVCMGGKCKKLGGGALLEEFQRAVGMEGVVVSGCKCMGKCRDGPNVKVLNGGGVAADRAPANAVCVGVDLEDVNIIVADLFGENQKQLEFATAAA